MGLKSDS